MVDIISKRSGPRREDERARSLIERNRGTITKLADQLSDGAYSASRRRAKEPAEPQASGLIISDLGAGRRPAEAEPYVRISPNRRVVIVDHATSRQMHFLGELRRKDGALGFVLATAENRFFTPLDAELAEKLTHLDGVILGAGRTEADLATEIGEVLGIA